MITVELLNFDFDSQCDGEFLDMLYKYGFSDSLVYSCANRTFLEIDRPLIDIKVFDRMGLKVDVMPVDDSVFGHMDDITKHYEHVLEDFDLD